MMRRALLVHTSSSRAAAHPSDLPMQRQLGCSPSCSTTRRFHRSQKRAAACPTYKFQLSVAYKLRKCSGEKVIEREVTNIAGYLNALRLDQDGTATWFRGHAKAEWTLLPGIMRSTSGLSEGSLLARFKQSAAMLTERLPNSSFDWTFLMQHYGVPTRLLDWSESPLVALFFAVVEFERYPNSDASVWCLKPTLLNKNAGILDPQEPQYIPSFDDTELQPYASENMRTTRVGLLPVASIATRNNARIQAQLGTFTIHHTISEPVESVGTKSHVIKYVIPQHAREGLHKELKLLGLTQFSLFPELASVGAILREMMK